MYKEGELTIYCSYHNSSKIYEYNLDYIPTYIKLFNTNDLNVNGDNINYLNKYLNELTTFYYVWKNNLYSKYIGFCHYRRFFMDLGYSNVTKYGYHYYGHIEYYLSCRSKELYFFEPLYQLYKYLLSTNKFNEDELYKYFRYGMSINAAWKDSYILTWENFVNICELQFGYLDYILGDFKNISNYSLLTDIRYYSFLSELSMGIIIAILNNNRTYENENWYDNDTSLITQSDDLDKILLWITKNNRTKAKKYIICNLLSEETDKLNIGPFYEPNCVKFVKSEKEIHSYKYVFKLNIDEYIKCLDFINFKKGNYTIEKI